MNGGCCYCWIRKTNESRQTKILLYYLEMLFEAVSWMKSNSPIKMQLFDFDFFSPLKLVALFSCEHYLFTPGRMLQVWWKYKVSGCRQYIPGLLEVHFNHPLGIDSKPWCPANGWLAQADQWYFREYITHSLPPLSQNTKNKELEKKLIFFVIKQLILIYIFYVQIWI